MRAGDSATLVHRRIAMAKRAAERRAEQWAEHRRQHDEEERQSRVMVITEFDAGDLEATMHALAEAILEYRRALRVLGRTVDLAKVGAPVAVIGPGPSWRPKRASEVPELPDAPPPAV